MIEAVAGWSHRGCTSTTIAGLPVQADGYTQHAGLDADEDDATGALDVGGDPMKERSNLGDVSVHRSPPK
jgi:hypothetical protein